MSTNDNPYRFIGCAYVMHIHIRASKTDLRMRACYLMCDPLMQTMTHRITIKLQLPGKSRLIFKF